MAVRAVVVGTADLDRAQHGGEVLAPIVDEFRLVSVPTVDPLTPVARVEVDQMLEQETADLVHGRPDGEVGRSQVEATERADLLPEADDDLFYCLRDLGLERLTERPLFSSPSPLSTEAVIGRVSQICSLTCTSCSTMPLKRL